MSAAAAAWAGSIATMIMCALAIGGLLIRLGRREGKIDQILDQLTEWQAGHDLEHRAGISARDSLRAARRGRP